MSIEALEQWVNGHKGRYVRDLSVDTGYGATCWNLVLGNINLRPKEDWFVEDERRAEIFAHEVDFFQRESDLPPNIVFASDGDSDEDRPGLGKFIEVAIQRANELGL